MVNTNFKLGVSCATGKSCAAWGTTDDQFVVVKALPDTSDPSTATLGVYSTAEDAAAIGAHIAIGADTAATKDAYEEALKKEVKEIVGIQKGGTHALFTERRTTFPGDARPVPRQHDPLVDTEAH